MSRGGKAGQCNALSGTLAARQVGSDLTMGLSGHTAYSLRTWIQSKHSCAAAKRCTNELLNLAEYRQHHDPVPRKVFKYLLEPNA